jgi:hypothetical protein
MRSWQTVSHALFQSTSRQNWQGTRVLLLRTPLSSRALQELSSTWHSHGLTSPTPCSRSVCTCMTLGSPIWRSWSASYTIFRERHTTVFFCVVRAALTSSSTQTLTGLVVQTHTTLHQAMRCSWGTIWFPSRPSGRPLPPAPALRLSTVSLPMAWLRPICCVSCSTSSRPHRLGAHLSTAIISALCTYPLTMFSINAPSMWRLIFILSERRLSLVKFVSSMSRWHHNSSTSSWRDSPPRCLMSFGPVSIPAVAELWLRGC